MVLDKVDYSLSKKSLRCFLEIVFQQSDWITHRPHLLYSEMEFIQNLEVMS